MEPTGVLIGPGSNLYGTTVHGGIANGGIVFRLVPPAEAGGLWAEEILYAFKGGSDGACSNYLRHLKQTTPGRRRSFTNSTEPMGPAQKHN